MLWTEHVWQKLQGLYRTAFGTSSDAEDALRTLRDEISKAEAVLDEARGRPGLQLLDQLLSRYLWGATASAGSLLGAAEACRMGGCGPLLRYMVETLIDLAYIFNGHGDVGADASEDERQRAWQDAAARIFVWDILEWDREWKLHVAVSGADPSLDDGRSVGQTAEQTVSDLATSLEAIGEDASPMREVFEARKAVKNPHWHWSEKGYKARLTAIERRVKGTDEEKDWKPSLEMLRALYPAVSDESHPPPGPKLIPFLHQRDGDIVVPKTEQNEPETVTRCARQASELLKMIRSIVAVALELDDAV